MKSEEALVNIDISLLFLKLVIEAALFKYTVE